jgi:hypothetical protein
MAAWVPFPVKAWPFFLKGTTMEQQVTREIAEQDFDRILKAARIKWTIYSKIIGRDADVDREIIIDAIEDGRITVNDEGFPTVYPDTQTEKLKEVKIFRRTTRGDKLAMDRVKDGHNIAKQDAVLAKFLGIAPGMLQLLEDRDYNLIDCLWTIFLGY